MLIKSIIGLQNLTNLSDLDLDSTANHIETIDLSGMTSLTFVDISDNDIPDSNQSSLTSINLSGCTSIETLNLDDSDFSGGFPDLSDLTSVMNIDFDQCDLIGSVDISNLLTLETFDFGDNDQLTELIISRNQPLGSGGYLYVNGCALTQTAVDNILVELSLNEVNDSYINLSGGTNSYPGATGLAALDVLDEKGWTWDVNEEPPSSVSIPASTDFDIVGNFTIEAFFIDKSGFDATNYPRLYSFGTWPSANSISIEPGGVYFWANNEQALYNNFSPILDQWHHICIIGSGDTLYMLIDGVQVASSLYEGAIYSQGLPLTIGSGGEVNTGFNGLISNFRWSAAVVYDPAGFTVPTATLANLEPTKLLIFQGTDLTSLLTDNSGYNHDATNAGGIYSELNPFVGATGSLSINMV